MLAAMRGRVDGLLLAPRATTPRPPRASPPCGCRSCSSTARCPSRDPPTPCWSTTPAAPTSAARHLLELGHRASPTSPAHWTRRQGPSATTLRRRVRRGRGRRAGRPRRVPRRGRLPGGDAPVRSLRRPTAVLAANNLMTVGLLRALHDLGLRHARRGVGDRVRRPPARRPARPAAHRDRPGHRDPGGGGDTDAARPAQRGDIRRGSCRAARDPADRSSLDGGAEEAARRERRRPDHSPPPSASAPSTWSSSVR